MQRNNRGSLASQLLHRPRKFSCLLQVVIRKLGQKRRLQFKQIRQ